MLTIGCRIRTGHCRMKCIVIKHWVGHSRRRRDRWRTSNVAKPRSGHARDPNDCAIGSNLQVVKRAVGEGSSSSDTTRPTNSGTMNNFITDTAWPRSAPARPLPHSLEPPPKSANAKKSREQRDRQRRSSSRNQTDR